MGIANGISVVKRQKDELKESAVLYCLPVTTKQHLKRHCLQVPAFQYKRCCCQEFLTPPLCWIQNNASHFSVG